MSLIVDSHHHFWDRSMSQFDHAWQENDGMEKICRTFLPEHLKPLIDAAGVDKTVFVQTQHNVEENRWVLGLAEENDWIAGADIVFYNLLTSAIPFSYYD